MSARIDRQELRRLIGIVRSKLSEIPSFGGSDNASWDTANSHREAVVTEIVAATGAVLLAAHWDGVSVKLAGIRATSTSGPQGALRNWATAAEKRLAAGGEVQP